MIRLKSLQWEDEEVANNCANPRPTVVNNVLQTLFLLVYKSCVRWVSLVPIKEKRKDPGEIENLWTISIPESCDELRLNRFQFPIM